jgi:hypothetical protein
VEGGRHLLDPVLEELDVGILAVGLEDRPWMAPRAEGEELGAQQADTGGRQAGGARGQRRHAHVQQQLGPRPR